MNLKLGSDGDLVINRGAETVSGQQLVAQLIGNRLKTIKGEWSLNTTIGVPWFTDLLIHTYDLELVHSWIYKTLASTPYVTNVNNLVLAVDSQGRKLLVSFEVSSLYGNIIRTIGV